MLLILFTVDLTSSYNAINTPSGPGSGLIESLDLFNDIANSRYTSEVPIVLLLHNSELFGQLLAKFPLKDIFVDYTGGTNVEKAQRYIYSRFEQLYQSHRGLTFFTTSFSSPKKSFRYIEAVVQDAIINRALWSLDKRGSWRNE